MKEFSALGNLKLIFGIPCVKVLFLDVAGMTNAHGLLTLRAIIPAEVTQQDVLRCENTPITVSMQDGGTVFSGMAVGLKLEHTAQYQELLITARTYSCLADQKRRSETFQNTGKNLGTGDQFCDGALWCPCVYPKGHPGCPDALSEQ